MTEEKTLMREEERVQRALEAIDRADARSLEIRKGKRLPRIVRRKDRGGTAFSIVMTYTKKS